MAEQEIGVVAHYFDRIQVAAIRMTGAVKVGDRIHIRGHSTDLVQVVGSMQIERAKVEGAGRGADVGIKVDQPVHEHDKVFKVT